MAKLKKQDPDLTGNIVSGDSPINDESLTSSVGEIPSGEVKRSDEYVRKFETEAVYHLPFNMGPVTIKGEVTLRALKNILEPIRNPRGGFNSPQIPGEIQLEGLEQVKQVVSMLGGNLRNFGKYLYSVELTLTEMVKAKRLRLESSKRRKTDLKNPSLGPLIANTGKSKSTSNVKFVSLKNLNPCYQNYDNKDFDTALVNVPDRSRQAIRNLWSVLQLECAIPVERIFEANLRVEDGLLKYFELDGENRQIEVTLVTPGKYI